MTNLDRPRVVELLGRLGAEDDRSVLEAARELNRSVTEAGLTWDDLLRAESALDDAEGERSDDAAGESSADDTSVQAGAEDSDADKAESMRLIGRLLARKDISGNLRQELTDLRRSSADGNLDAMDSRYIRALAKRLGV